MKTIIQFILTVSILSIFSTVSAIATEEPEYAPRHRYTIADFLPEDGKLRGFAYDSSHLALLSAAVIGGIALLPEDKTNWFDNNKDYSRNVKQGACMDKDEGFFNYLAHPYVGALYYTLARQNGFNRLQSFGYCFLVSTVFWEYGLEAYFQRPSTQDLIITPLAGLLLGWTFEKSVEYIKSNDGKLFNSKKVGNVAIFIMNPMNPTINTSKSLTQYFANRGIVLTFVLNEPFYSMRELKQFNSYNLEPQQLDTWAGIMLEYRTDIVNDFFEYLAETAF